MKFSKSGPSNNLLSTCLVGLSLFCLSPSRAWSVRQATWSKVTRPSRPSPLEQRGKCLGQEGRRAQILPQTCFWKDVTTDDLGHQRAVSLPFPHIQVPRAAHALRSLPWALGVAPEARSEAAAVMSNIGNGLRGIHCLHC